MKILITGVAGFIGFHVAERLLAQGHDVVGIDNLNDYYDVNLKGARLARIETQPNFRFLKLELADRAAMAELFAREQFERVIHLGAQAGVRYSIDNPHAYADANLVGHLNVLEGCRQNGVGHLLYASSSSVYGLNRKTPFSTSDSVDHPVSLYAATKKANELMSHSYAHLYDLPTTGLRFFTVYGPWGRPDMALFKFTQAILAGHPIDVYNQGDMRRDFTYIDDIVDGIVRCVKAVNFDQYEIFNIGNNRSERLTDMIGLLAAELGVTPRLEFVPMQDGDVPATWADISKLRDKTGYQPTTPITVGIPKLAAWYRAYVAGR